MRISYDWWLWPNKRTNPVKSVSYTVFRAISGSFPVRFYPIPPPTLFYFSSSQTETRVSLSIRIWLTVNMWIQIKLLSMNCSACCSWAEKARHTLYGLGEVSMVLTDLIFRDLVLVVISCRLFPLDTTWHVDDLVLTGWEQAGTPDSITFDSSVTVALTRRHVIHLHLKWFWERSMFF